MAQGEKSEVMVQYHPTEQVIPSFLPIPVRRAMRLSRVYEMSPGRSPLLLMSQVQAKLMGSKGPSPRPVSQLNLEWILILSRRKPMAISNI